MRGKRNLSPDWILHLILYWIIICEAARGYPIPCYLFVQSLVKSHCYFLQSAHFNFPFVCSFLKGKFKTLYKLEIGGDVILLTALIQ